MITLRQKLTENTEKKMKKENVYCQTMIWRKVRPERKMGNVRGRGFRF